MRQFYFVNNDGQRYQLQNGTTKTFLWEPGGLGFEYDIDYKESDGFFFNMNTAVAQVAKTGTLVFHGTDPYSDYKALMDYLAKSTGLRLAYAPKNNWYYVDIDVESVDKTEIELDGTLQCSIVMMPKTPFYLPYEMNIDLSGDLGTSIKQYDYGYYADGKPKSTDFSDRTASDTGYRYRLWFSSKDGTQWIPANLSTSTNNTDARTPNTRPINPFGAIIYAGNTSPVNQGSTITSNMYEDRSIYLGYSFNKDGGALTLTPDEPVYLKCNPLGDGTAEMIETTQTLPIAEDGYWYIYLGYGVDATHMQLVPNHLVFTAQDKTVEYYYTYSNTAVAGEIEFTIPAQMDSGLEITIPGAISAPSMEFFANGKKIGEIDLTSISVQVGEYVRYSSIPISAGVYLYSGGAEADITAQIGLNADYPTFFLLPPNQTIKAVLQADVLTGTTASIKVYEYFRSV